MAEARRHKAGRQRLWFLHFKGTFNWYLVEEKSYCVLPDRQLWNKNPDRCKMSFVFLKNDRLFRTFNHRLTSGVGK